MYITYQNQQMKLEKKERKLGSEAPAIRVKMDNAETKVIGMMADKVQVFITVPFENGFSQTMKKLIENYQDKALIYLFCPKKITTELNIDTSTDFEETTLKLGVNINDQLCAKSIFIINKDGEFIYKEILETLEDEFDTKRFDTALDEAIKFKKKGHTHENWMG